MKCRVYKLNSAYYQKKTSFLVPQSRASSVSPTGRGVQPRDHPKF